MSPVYVCDIFESRRRIKIRKNASLSFKQIDLKSTSVIIGILNLSNNSFQGSLYYHYLSTIIFSNTVIQNINMKKQTNKKR
jgi:hypothetical protein